MKKCKGCVFVKDARKILMGEYVRGFSPEEHPCFNCERFPRDTNYPDNYSPKVDKSTRDVNKESKWCECEGMTEMTPRYVREYHCDKCGKKIAPFYDGSKPKPKLPEKLGLSILTPGVVELENRETINKILDYLKERE